MTKTSPRSRTLKSVAMDWGEDSGIYGPRDYFRNNILLKEFHRYARGKTILDYGCGVGNMLMYFACAGYTVTGIEYSKAAFEYVKKRVADSSWRRRVQTYCGTFETIPIPSRSYDTVWCGEVLEHVPDDTVVVKNFHRILKPGGRCFISVPKGMNFWSDVDEYNGHYRRYSEEQLTSLFERNGFVIERMYVWGFPFTRAWDRMVYYPLFRKKMRQKIIYQGSSQVLSRILHNRHLVQLASKVFEFDQLWNWTKLGKGFILVARKPERKP